MYTTWNSLPNNIILDWSKLKEFADDKINLTKNLKLVLGKVENQHFLLFLLCFQKALYSESLKPGIVWERVCIKNNSSISHIVFFLGLPF